MAQSLAQAQRDYHRTARSMTERAPFLFEADADAVICKDSGILFCLEYEGPNPSDATQADFDSVAERAERACRLLADRNVTVWQTMRRRRTRRYPAMPMPDPVSQRVEDRRRETFQKGGAFRNRFYLSFLILPETGSNAFFERFHYFATVELMAPPRAIWYAARAMFSARDAFAYSAGQLDTQLERTRKFVKDFTASMPDVRFRVLEGEERLGFLQSAYPRNGGDVDRVGSPGDGWFLDAWLPDQHFVPGAEYGIFRGHSDHFVAALAIKTRGYPAGDKKAGGTAPRMLAPLLAIDGEITISQCFRVASREEQLAHVNGRRRFNEMAKLSPKQWMSIAMRTNRENPDEIQSKNAAKEEFSAEANAAIADITRGEIFYGWHNLTVLAHGETLEEMKYVVGEADRAIRKAQMVPLRETIHLDSAIGGTVPGQWADVVHWHFLSSANFADLVPWHTVDGGTLLNTYLTEQLGVPCLPLVIAVTRDKTVYFLHSYVGDLPHLFVAGPSRTGKTVFCNYVWTRFRQYPRANVIILDRDFSCRIATLLRGGQHVAVSTDAAALRANNLSFAPVAALLGSPEHWVWLGDWIRLLIEMNGYKMRTDEECNDVRAVWEALIETAALPDRSLWTLSTVRTHLPPHLKSHLEQWLGDGPYAHFFDNETDAFELGKLTCIEIGDVLKNPRLAAPFMLYVFMRVDAKLAFTSTPKALEPTLIYVEECSFVLNDPIVKPHLRGWAATLAKRLTTLMLTTQSIEDYKGSDIFPAIRDNFPTRIFLPNPNAKKNVDLHALYTTQFQLNDAQADALGEAIPKKEYLVVQPDSAVMIELNFDEENVATLRSDRLAQQVFDRHYKAGQYEPGWEQAYIDDLLATERHAKATAGDLHNAEEAYI
uniref:VirB4 family type IV secretion system protein n=1 Tax=Burkholderia arboris TaxID=488730 RepID=UPI003BEEC1AD